MILKSKETTVAYRCPVCGKNIISMVGIFMLSGDLIKLKCDCGGSELTVTRTADRKYRLRVPCVICPDPHSFVLSANAFFDKDLLALTCPYSDITACFIGTKEKVLEAAEKSDEELFTLLREAGFKDYDQFSLGKESVRQQHETKDGRERSESYLDDTEVADIVNFMLTELNDENNLHCACPKDQTGEYGFTYEKGRLTVLCRKCGASVTLPMATTGELNQFLHIDALRLEAPEDVPVIDFDSLPTIEEHIELNGDDSDFDDDDEPDETDDSDFDDDENPVN